MRKMTLTHTAVLISLTLCLGNPLISYAADDFFANASTITSTRARQQRDRSYVRKTGFWKKSEAATAPTQSPAVTATSTEMKSDAIAYPTGNVNTSTLLLRKTYPAVVRTDKPFEYIINVTNLTNFDLNNVNVSEIIPEGFELIGTEPAITQRAGDSANWSLGKLAPKSTTAIRVKGKAVSNKVLPCCTSADYELPALCATTDVVQPAMSLKLALRPEAMVCHRIPVQYTVKNTGDSPITDIQVNSTLPSGMTSLAGESRLAFRVDRLGIGESKTVTQYASAARTGTFAVDAKAASGDITAKAESQSMRVTQPQFELTMKTDRDTQYVGRTVDYSVTLKNMGDATAESTVLKVSVPGESRITSASKGGAVAGRTANWSLGPVPPGNSQTLNMTVQGLAAGTVPAQAQIAAVCATPVQKTAAAQFKGIPALLLEVVDLLDPIAVGEEEIYEIKVPGELDESWSKWTERLTVTSAPSGAGLPVTTLTGTLDQAALHGLLRRLYSCGLPLISITWIVG